MMTSICSNGIHDLLAGKKLVYSCWRDAGEVTFTPEGDEVVIALDEHTSARYRRRELIQALAACGARYGDYLSQLHDGDARWNVRRAFVDTAAANARRALESDEASKPDETSKPRA